MSAVAESLGVSNEEAHGAWVSGKAVADALNALHPESRVSYNGLLTASAAGRLPFKMEGKRRVFDVDALEAACRKLVCGWNGCKRVALGPSGVCAQHVHASLYTGVPVSSKTRRRIGDANRGRKHPPEFGAAIAERNRGRHVSDETRRRMSAALQGRPVSAATRKKISESWVRRRARDVRL